MKSDIKNLRIFSSAPLYKDAMVQIAAKSVRHNSQNYVENNITKKKKNNMQIPPA